MSSRNVITRGEAVAAVRALALDTRYASVADPLGFADLLQRPERVGELIQERIEADTTPSGPATYSWPKDRGTRLMTYLDPYDEVFYRALVGRFVKQMAKRIDHARVLTGAMERRGPHWRLEPYGRAVTRRSTLALEWLDQDAVKVMLTLDVQDFFYEISSSALALSLSPLPGPGRSKATLMRWLNRTADATGVSGLPVGHDSSRALANHLLVRSDHGLDGAERSLRFWDDTWVFTSTDDEAIAWWASYEAAVKRDRLRLNRDKCNRYDPDEGREVVRSSVIDYFDIEATAAPQPGLAVGEARELFDLACTAPIELKRELRRSLTVLRKRGDPHPLDAFRSDPNLIQVAPDHWRKYFSGLGRTKEGRVALDREWVVESVCTPRSDHPDAERLALLPVLSTMKPNKAGGRRLLGLSTDSDVPPPIQVRAAQCWGRAEGWKRQTAIDCAVEAPDLGTRRAFAATLRETAGSDAKVLDALPMIERLDSELGPVCAWVASAA